MICVISDTLFHVTCALSNDNIELKNDLIQCHRVNSTWMKCIDEEWNYVESVLVCMSLDWIFGNICSFARFDYYLKIFSFPIDINIPLLILYSPFVLFFFVSSLNTSVARYSNLQLCFSRWCAKIFIWTFSFNICSSENYAVIVR